MRLLNCQLQNVRLHGDLELNFSPRITLIGGPNESGKSTLVEALHRALFLKASATGAPVEALQSRLAELGDALDDARAAALHAHDQAVASMRRDLVPVSTSALVVWKPSR